MEKREGEVKRRRLSIVLDLVRSLPFLRGRKERKGENFIREKKKERVTLSSAVREVVYVPSSFLRGCASACKK